MVAFVSFSAQFGGKASKEKMKQYESSPNYLDGKFVNQAEFNMAMDCHSVEKMMVEMFNPDPNIAPKKNLSVIKMDSLDITQYPDSMTRVTWFGHSTALLEIEGKKVLFDPVFGQYASPHPWLGRKRYNEEMPISIEKLPTIDAVIISHDHYDHLDYESIAELNSKTAQFFVPLGVGNHLAKWGVSWDKINEMDWWDETTLDDLTIACTPSRHMSGRGMSDQFATLWGSWVIKGASKSIFFSGDGGYGTRFQQIGEKYGPFDLSLIECGQYNNLWADVHMTPEETVQAGIDLQSKLTMPIHWGSFTLATHSWTDPIKRVTKESKRLHVSISTPQIGESISVGSSDFPISQWWEEYE